MTRKLLTALLCAALLSCGDDPAGPSSNLSVTVTAPPSQGASASDSYTVEWTGQGTGTVSLYYNTVQGPAGQKLIASGLPVSGNHDWDLSQVPNGSYYVRALLSSGTETASDYSDGTLTVDHTQGEPGIVVTSPPAEGASANESYTVTWVSSGFTDGQVTLWFDTDTLPEQGLVEIAKGLPDTGEYVWDCSTVPEGFYYIRARIEDGENDASSYSQGTLFINHGAEPWITVEKPSSQGDEADNFYTIEWSSEAPQGATVTLWYDVDTDPSYGLFPIANGVYNDGYFTWDCSGVPEGSYYVYAQLMSPSDSGRAFARVLRTLSRGTLASDYSDGTLTISHDLQYSITVTAPPASGAQADQSYLVEWESDGPPSAELSLFYAADTTGAPLYPVASGVMNSGEHLWDTSMVPEGSWFIFAAFTSRGQGSDWSSGTVNVVHDDMYTFSFTAPPAQGATADDSYTLMWDTSAPYGSTWVYLFYATSTEPGGTLYPIVQGAVNAGQYNWNCSSVPEGEYWIYGFVTDNRERDPNPDRGSGSAWSQGMLTIDHSLYSITVTAPPAGGAAADSSYTIEWTASGGPGSLIALYYDDDTNPSQMYPIASGLQNSGSYLWNTIMVPEGDWYVYAVIYDPDKGPPVPVGDGSAGDYSDGVLTIEHEYNYIIVTAPPPWGAYAQTEYNIQWAADTPYGGTVSLYYDVDTDPGNGMTLITAGLAWNDFAYMWDCSSTPEGEYYIYAKLENSQQTLTSYSQGTLIIDREPLWMVFTAPPAWGAGADASYTLKWYSVGPSGRTVDLYYDTDTDPSGGLVPIASGVACPQYESEYTWNCSAVPEGSYYIYGVLSDPSVDGTYQVYSEGMLTIEH